MERRRPTWSELLLAGTVVVIAVLIVAVARHGVVVTPDSLVYRGVSEQLRSGGGITVPFSTFTSSLSPAEVARFGGAIPLTDQPPLYPALLAALGALGFGFDAAVLTINLAALVAIAASMLGIARRMMTRHAAALSTTGVLLVLSIGPMSFERDAFVSLFASALSEPTMLAFALGALWALMRHLDDGHLQDGTRWALPVATLLSMAAVLTRFSGVAVPATVALAVVLWGHGSRVRRWITASACAGLATLPAVAILAVNQQRLGAESRLLGVHRIGELAGEYRRSVAAMLWPSSLSETAAQGTRELLGGVVLVVVVGMFAGSFVLARRVRSRERGDDRSRTTIRVLATFCVVYAVVFVASRLLLDSTLLPTGRFLAPALVPLGLLVARSIVAAPSVTVRCVRVAATVLLVVVLTLSGVAGVWRAALDGWTTRRPPDAALGAALASVADVELIFSNAPDSVWRDSGRSTAMVPCRTEWFSGAPNDDFDAQVDELVALVEAGDAAVIVGPAFLTQANCLGSEDLLSLGLERVAEWPEGQLFTAAG